MLIIGILLILFSVVLLVLLGSSLGAIVDLASFIFVLICYSGLLIASGYGKDFVNGMRHLLNRRGDKKELKGSIRCFSLLQKGSIPIAIIGFLIGIIRMLQHLDDPSQIGPALAVALLISLYVAIIYLVIILPVKFKLRKLSEDLGA